MKLRVVTHLSFTEGIQLIVKSVEDEAPYECLTDKPPWHMITLMLKCVTPVDAGEAPPPPPFLG